MEGVGGEKEKENRGQYTVPEIWRQKKGTFYFLRFLCVSGRSCFLRSFSVSESGSIKIVENTQDGYL